MISVLYVDDEPGLLDIGKIFLERFGDFSVSTVDSASAALEILKKEQFDAIISDFQMPGTDGLEFLKQVRILHGQVPFILFTGRGREEVVILALNLGADYYLQKGGDPQSQFAELAHKVRSAVRQRQAEIALEESERRYRDVVETQTEFISRFKPDGTHVFANDAYCRHFKKRCDEIIGHRFVPSIPDEDRGRVRSHFASFTPDHPVADIEHRVFMPDGCIHWHWWNDHAIFDDAGRIIEYQSIGKDITDRKRVEEELKQSENLYRTIFTTTGAATIIIAPDTTILLANKGWEELTGLSRSEQENKLSWTVFFDKDDAGRMVRYHQARRNNPSLAPSVYETRLIDAQKRVHNCVVYVHMIPGTKNSVASLVDITDRNKAEESLRESEERFRVMAESSPFAIVVYQDNRIIYVNDYTSKISGYSKEDLYTTELSDLFHPESRELVRERGLARQRRETVPDGYEVKLISRQGETRFAYLSAGKILLGGKTAGIATIVDITPQKKIAEALQKSEERYRSVVNDQTDMICRFTPDGIVTFTNDAYRQFFHPRLALTDLEGKKIRDLMQIENYGEVENFLGSLTPEAPIRNLERAVTGKDGKNCWQLWSVRALFDMYGKPAEYQVVGRDITEQKRSSAALADSEFRLRSFIEATRESVTLVDEEGKVIEWNPGAERISGIKKEEALGRYLWDLTFSMIPREHRTEEHRAALEQSIRTMLWTGVPVFKEPQIVEAERTDGTRIFTRQTIFPIRTGKGFRFGSIAEDITEEKRAEEALLRANKKLSLLTGITRHDINNQLAVLNGYVGLLQNNIPDPTYKEYFSRIMKASSQIAAMIRFTSEYEKIGTGSPVWQDLGTVLDRAETGILPGQITLLNDLPDGTGVYADPLIVKVFFNLLDNSLRHGQRVTEIQVTSHRSGEDLVVVWEDNGVGIPAKDKERIFERGFGKNTGLGMFLAREILSLTGITIRENGDPGNGARFEMVVPAGMWRQGGESGNVK